MSISGLSRQIVGVDGCKAGWVAVTMDVNAARPAVSVHRDFSLLLEVFSDEALIAVDMPIGLPEVTEKGGRPAEIAARKLPTVPKSSIFSIPSRQAVYAEQVPLKQADRLAAHKRAVAVARSTSNSGSGFSIQAFCILPKIIEIDRLLRENQSLGGRVLESHPEVAFRRLNGWKPLARKKIGGRQNPAGVEERKAILFAHGFERRFLDQRLPPKVGVDDFLDAAAMMLVAARRLSGIAEAHPCPTGIDGYGIQIAIWA